MSAVGAVWNFWIPTVLDPTASDPTALDPLFFIKFPSSGFFVAVTFVFGGSNVVAPEDSLLTKGDSLPPKSVSKFKKFLSTSSLIFPYIQGDPIIFNNLLYPRVHALQGNNKNTKERV